MKTKLKEGSDFEITKKTNESTVTVISASHDACHIGTGCKCRPAV